MKLLHPYVDIVPGRPGMRPTTAILSESQVVPGSAVVRLVNTTDQENAYTLRLNCEETYWQDEWFTMISLPPDPSKGENAPPSGKPDVRGPQDHWVKLFVPRGGKRDVLIRFNVPQKAECRAKRYRYQVEVETQIVGPNVGARRRDRVTILDGTATIQPFYKWSIDITPEEHRVNLLNRKGKYELIVTNEGNDWLYCEIKPGRRKELVLETPTIRAAVPPPEPGETITVSTDTSPRTGVQRTIPVRAISKLKLFRGAVTPLPIPVSAIRVDAPTVPHAFDDGSYSGSQAVIAVPTAETANPPMDRNLTFVPALPSNFTDFVEHSGTFVKGLFMTAVGAVFAVIMGFSVYENVFHNNVLVEPTTLNVAANGTMTVRGTWLQGANIFIGTADATGPAGTAHNWTLVPAKPKITDWSECTVTVPSLFNHEEIKVKAQRAVQWFPFLSGIMPFYISKSVVQVGSVPTVSVVQPPVIGELVSGIGKPGQSISISGSNLGKHGIVLFNNAAFNADSWSPSRVTATVPATAVPGQLIVQIQPDGASSALPAGTLQVPVTPASAAATAAAAAAAAAGGATAAAGGAGAAGGTAAPMPITQVIAPPPSIGIKPITQQTSRPAPVQQSPVNPVYTNPVAQPAKPRTASNNNPPPSTETNSSGLTAKQQFKEQIVEQQAALKTEESDLNNMIAQRNALYLKVQQTESTVDLHDQRAVDQYNALVAQANTLNNSTNDATTKYRTHVEQVNTMINQYNAMR